MSNLDVPVKTLNDTVHPMIYYLMQYNDKMTDEVRARYFNEAEYPSFDKIDDLSIMLLVDYVLKKRNEELKKLHYEIEKQKEDERMDLVYYKYEEGLYTYKGDKLKEHETRKEDEPKKHQTHKKDDDDDVEDEDSDNYFEKHRKRKLKKLNYELEKQKEDASKDLVYYKYEEFDDDDKLKEHETRKDDDDDDKLKEHETRKEDELKKHQTHKKDDDDDVEDEDSDD